VSQRAALLERGAIEATNNPALLVETVLRVLGRAAESPGELSR